MAAEAGWPPNPCDGGSRRGTLLRQQSEQDVKGLTTATSIWVVAGVGAAAGLGLWAPAGIAAVLALLILAAGGHVDDAIARQQGNRRDS